MPRQRKSSGETGVRSVERAIAILNAFSRERPSLSVVELQAISGLSRPTLYRLLETLSAHGLIRTHGNPQRFSLDYQVGRLAHAWSSGLAPAAIAQPFLDRLHTTTRETVALVMRRGHVHLYVVELPSPHVLSMSRGIGPMDHLTKGASGKSILSAMPDREIEDVLMSVPKGTDVAKVRRDINKIRQDGYFVARSEIFSGAVGIASAFHDHAFQPIGAIVVFGPESRFDDSTIKATTKLVVAATAGLSRALGYIAPSQKMAPLSRSR